MAYSKAYQTVEAGRVREDEAIGFFKQNRVAVPGRTVSITATGGVKQPVLQKDALDDRAIGKPTGRAPESDAWKEESCNTGIG